MRFEVSQIYEGLPSEINKDLEKIYYPIYNFVTLSSLNVTGDTNYFYQQTLDIKENFLEILSTLTSLVNKYITPKSRKESAEMIFYLENLGLIHSDLTGGSTIAVLSEDNTTSKVPQIIRFSEVIDNIKNHFDMAFYRPLISCKDTPDSLKNSKDFFKEFFKLSSNNCQIIGNSLRGKLKQSGVSKSKISQQGAEYLNRTFPEKNTSSREIIKEKQ